LKITAPLLALTLSISPSPLVPRRNLQRKRSHRWEGNPELWSVEDGTITGRTSADKPLKHNTFLVWKDGKVGDFELTFKYRIEKGNSGVQYRSKLENPGEFGPIVSGYQADFEAGETYSGILYEERGRGILAERGAKTVIRSQEKIRRIRSRRISRWRSLALSEKATRSRRRSRTRSGTTTASSRRETMCSISSMECRPWT
jgi:hypothetical protein